MQIVANGTPNMTVVVSAGSACIPTGTYPSSYDYFVGIDTTTGTPAGESVTITTANATNPRKDLVVAYVDVAVTAVTSPVNNTNNMLKLAVVAGTPAVSPVDPTSSAIQTAIGASNPYIILGRVNVLAATTTITNANIQDLRTMAYPVGATAADGWVPDADTWTYVSATSFKIANKDVTARFPTGTKIKLTQTTLKYFYVASAVFGTDTTITLTAGSDYSLANAAITTPCYSSASAPQGHPIWFNFAPALTGFSANPTTTGTRFSMQGHTCTASYSCFGGTSNASTLTVGLPLTASTNGGSYVRDFTVRGQNNGSVGVNAALLEFDSGATVASVYNDLTGAAWTSSGTKGFRGVISFEV